MKIYKEGIFEKDGVKYVPTYRDGKLWANWGFSGNAPDDYPGVGVPDGYMLVSGSVRVRQEPGDFMPMIDWHAIKEDLSEFMHCKNHFE